MPAERGQTTAQLRLEDHDQCDRQENRKTSHEPADHQPD